MQAQSPFLDAFGEIRVYKITDRFAVNPVAVYGVGCLMELPPSAVLFVKVVISPL